MTKPLRLVFAGTPEFSVPPLECLLAGPDTLLAVYTQPDRPAGRGRQLQPSPVKQRALEAGIEVRQPLNFKDPEERARLAALAPDLMIVVAYGLILPQKVLDIPRYGCWNLHASLLPRWRGAAPIQRAIEAGDAETGVDLMQMERGLDTGPVLLERRTPIHTDDTGGSLHDRLAGIGAELLVEGLARLRAGAALPSQVQPEQGVTYAYKLDKSEARLDFNQPALALERRVRAFNPWPICDCELAGERLRVHAAQAIDSQSSAVPGTVLAASAAGIDIACGAGALRLIRVQREGGRAQPVADYLNARRTPLLS
ncbi:MAG: methionyl-tRNA formyltransferase [Xanthomonadales bacterium]|nr:methionyl-tRNA formyltransferase [Xanthomonadales bacterium]